MFIYIKKTCVRVFHPIFASILQFEGIIADAISSQKISDSLTTNKVHNFAFFPILHCAVK